MLRAPGQRGSRADWIAPVVVALVTFVAFLPALTNGFVTWDDDKNFLDNIQYRGLGLDQLRWMWTTFLLGHYVPLTWMTLGLDYTLWGMNAPGYHLTSLLLHTANAVALYFLARRLLRLSGVVPADADDLQRTVPPAVAALLFAIHPLRVESVVWVTERRDCLSLFFCFMSVLAYLRSLDHGRSWPKWYWSSVALFACALLSKATAMTLPAVLFLLNVYPLRRIRLPVEREAVRRLVVELIPFGLLTSASIVLSLVALKPPSQLNPFGKFVVSSYSLALYLWKTIVPVRLSPLYQMPQPLDPIAPMFVLSYFFVAAFAWFIWSLRRRWPGAVTALVIYIVVILPMLGVVQNGPQIAADRYTYFATPALAILAGAGLSLFWRQRALLLAAISAGALLTLGTLTWKQAQVWHDSETFWTHVLRLDEKSSSAHNALAGLLLKQDKIDDAIAHYRQAVAIDTMFPDGHNNLGVALIRQGKFAEAIGEYQRALAIKPQYAEAHNNWGAALAHQGDITHAIEHYREALAIDSTNADAHVNLGNALVRLDKPDEAIAQYQAALRLKPDHADAHHNWGVALARQGKLVEAIGQFRMALAINPEHAEAKEFLERANELLRGQHAP